MRTVIFGAIILLLSGCGASVQTPAPAVRYAPRPAPLVDYPRAPRKLDKARPKLETKPQADAKQETKPQPELKQDSRPWDITEDRFISTHPPEMSSDALKRTPDEITGRLKELNIDLNLVPTRPKG